MHEYSLRGWAAPFSAVECPDTMTGILGAGMENVIPIGTFSTTSYYSIIWRIINILPTPHQINAASLL